MLSSRTLDALAIGESAIIAALRASGAAQRRLLELGFVPGATVTALHRALWGDPTAYAVCGAVIALRRDDAREIVLL